MSDAAARRILIVGGGYIGLYSAYRLERRLRGSSHTLTIVKKSDLPKTGAQVENCRACQRYATPHLKNPKAPPDEHNPIVHWTLDRGQPGLDTVGDSLAIQQPGPHKSITATVTAPAGTTLYFLCAVHPWMQGKIVVTS